MCRETPTKLARFLRSWQHKRLNHPRTPYPHTNIDGKPKKIKRRYAAFQRIRQRARRARANHSSTLSVISQNTNGLPQQLQNENCHHKREILFHKFHHRGIDIALLQECFNYRSQDESFIHSDNTQFIAHSTNTKCGGIGFLLNHRAQAAWSAAGSEFKHFDVSGIT